MQSKELENLVKVGQLKHEAFSQAEFDTTVRSGGERLQDASSTQFLYRGNCCLPMGPPTPIRLPHCACSDTDRQTDTSYFRLFPIH